jgi:hypothetical protein
VARLPLAGQKIAIRLLATGKTVATATVASNGTFSTTAPLPPPGIRQSNLARYQAVAGSMKSLPMKLHRRMYVTRVGLSSSTVTLQGRVTRGFRAGTEVTVYARQTCTTQRVVGRAKLTRTGTFSVTVPRTVAPEGEVALFRASTEVLFHGHPFPTFTLQTAPGVS